jgi:hypothetical protein
LTTANAAAHPTIDTTIASNATHPNREAAHRTIPRSKRMGLHSIARAEKH